MAFRILGLCCAPCLQILPGNSGGRGGGVLPQKISAPSLVPSSLQHQPLYFLWIRILQRPGSSKQILCFIQVSLVRVSSLAKHCNLPSLLHFTYVSFLICLSVLQCNSCEVLRWSLLLVPPAVLSHCGASVNVC